ncbi:unnamed protein product [Polarella glacialis]|uniref:Uncharacterized protein n=1 Tax=Polarella glacialis TaxID=89957 RepID=A0A813FGQ0_POLGL|nr:unnamed protein product [Polarella glacialis]
MAVHSKMPANSKGGRHGLAAVLAGASTCYGSSGVCTFVAPQLLADTLSARRQMAVAPSTTVSSASSFGVTAGVTALATLATLAASVGTARHSTARSVQQRRVAVSLQARGAEDTSDDKRHKLDSSTKDTFADLRDELDKIVEQAGSELFLRGVLNKIQTPEQVTTFLHRYTVVSGDFAGGAASLAGAVHVHRDKFLDPEEPIFACADRSAEIASHIFFAIEDEYKTRAGSRLTHRRLGQIILSETVKFFGFETAYESRCGPKHQMSEALKKIGEGYRINRAHTAEDLFFAFGWHLGSELLGDQEFNLVDEFLKAKFPKLVAYLESKQVQEEQTAYHWIQVHTYVEEEHFSHGLMAAVLAIHYYHEPHKRAEVRQMILDGARAFVDFQQVFFGNILSDRFPAL